MGDRTVAAYVTPHVRKSSTLLEEDEERILFTFPLQKTQDVNYLIHPAW